MKYKFLFLMSFLGMSMSAPLWAAANVQIVVSDLSKISFWDRDPDKRNLSVLEIHGTIIQTDATVNGLPDVLPQRVRLGILRKDEQETTLINTCREMAMAAKKEKGTFIVEVVLSNTQDFLNKIVGGNLDPRFNSIFLTPQDSGVLALACSYR